TCRSDVDPYPMRDRLGDDFGQRRPADRRYRPDQLVLHQIYRLAEKEYFNLVPALGEGVGMKKGEGGLRRFIRAPCALDQHLHGCVPSSLRRYPTGTPVWAMPPRIAPGSIERHSTSCPKGSGRLFGTASHRRKRSRSAPWAGSSSNSVRAW